MKLVDDGECRFQAVLDDVADGDIVRQSDRLAGRHELSVGDQRIHPADERTAEAESGPTCREAELNSVGGGLLRKNKDNNKKFRPMACTIKI